MFTDGEELWRTSSTNTAFLPEHRAFCTRIHVQVKCLWSNNAPSSEVGKPRWGWTGSLSESPRAVFGLPVKTPA